MYNILICDDDRDIAAAVEIYLSTQNCRILMAHDGQEALELVRREDIHLVLMDIMMPKMDGITATARIRQESNVPIILLTAKSEDADKILGNYYLNLLVKEALTLDPEELKKIQSEQLMILRASDADGLTEAVPVALARLEYKLANLGE